jgi:hypothetical protein
VLTACLYYYTLEVDTHPPFFYTAAIKTEFLSMSSQDHHLPGLNPMIVRQCAFLIFLCLFLVKGVAMADSSIDFFRMLPPEIDGWKRSGPPEIYDRKTLFKYIDGGAELYISYYFEKLTAFRYVRGNDEEIKVDLFDMGNSYNAYGVFSHGRESVSTEVGQGSEYSLGLLNFWKDRFYVSLLGYPESREKHQVILKLGSEISRLIPRDGPEPVILSYLPSEGLIAESIRYFHHYIWLNTHYFISNDNILLIDSQTEAALAKYNSESGKYVLILLKYSSPQQAQAAVASFLKHYLSAASAGIMRIKNGRFAGIRRSGTCLAVILDAAHKKTVEDVLARTIKKLK